MVIGIPKEILERERRVAALPDEVAGYVEMGFEVIVQSTAGEGARFSDADYEAAGARVVPGAKDVFDGADIILKVKQPHFNADLGKHEAELVREGTTLITFLHPAAPQSHDIVRTLRDRKITSLTMDGIPRIPRARNMDALASMSQVTGYKSVILAAAALRQFVSPIETPLGTTTPAEFLIVGTGVVGMQSILTAEALGADVKAVDIRKAARDRAAAAGANVVGIEIPEEFAEAGSCDSAGALPADWLERVREGLEPLVASADVIITSALVPGEVAPILITKEMVASMKPGSVIVDVSVDQGGNCEVTVPAEAIEYNGVTVMGYINIPGALPVHSSWLYSKNMLEFVKNAFKNGVDELDWSDEVVQSALVTKDGAIVHRGTLHALGEC